MSAQPEDFASAFDFARRATAPVARLNELAVRNLERTARLQYELAGDWMQLGLEQMRAAATAGDLGTLLTRQAEIAGQFAEKVARRQKDLAKMTADTQADFARWVDESSSS